MNLLFKNVLLMVLMFTASGVAMALHPTHKITEDGIKINLETLIPKHFGQWNLDDTVVPIKVSPDVQAELNVLYNQTLARTYTNSTGERVMLSIAYGDDQDRTMQVHRPEVCYAAQGFIINNMTKSTIDANGTKLPVMKMVATQGQRIEPIIYWVMIGNAVVRGNLEQGFARLKYGLGGKIPYGILIRVSTISANELQSYSTEEQFVHDMLISIPETHRKILTGAS
jgi:EpsI family protein